MGFRTIHHNNIHALAIEMYKVAEIYKVANDMSRDIMNGVLKLRNTPHYNLRYTPHFSTDPIHSVYNGTESASYLGPKVWEQILAETKNKDIPLMVLRKKLKKWKPTECP